MLENILHFAKMNIITLSLTSLLIAALGTGILYVFLFYILRPIFRSFEGELGIVILNISTYPALIVFAIFSLEITFEKLVGVEIFPAIEHILRSIIVVTLSYWFSQLFNEVFLYYLKGYTQQTEVMWDDVLLPILSAVVPVLIFIGGSFFVLNSFGIDLTGIWVALGGATFVLGFALQDILANFFSGIVLLIDTPFRFGDILLLEDESIGMLRQIGIRVTHLYIFSTHCDVYIPNSVLQGQTIKNLSRPTSFYYHSISIEIPAECDLDESKKLMEEIVLAHPDTIGDIDTKLEVIPEYYNYDEADPNLIEQQEIGNARVMAEQAVNWKLEEIEQALEALAVTMGFAEKAGLTPEEKENIQQEYQGVLEIMGFQVLEETNNNRTLFNFEESDDREGLIELVREWYRLGLKDPNLLDEDQYFISDEWERKINLLKRRAQRLSQKISNPQADETRLDDYVVDFRNWLKEKFKAPRKKWQEPKVRMTGMTHNDEGAFYMELEIAFFVDDIKLEDGKRGERVKSQIYQEIFRHFKESYLNENGIQEEESQEYIANAHG